MKTAEIISQSALVLIIIFVIIISFQHERDNAMFPPERIKDTVIAEPVKTVEKLTGAEAIFYTNKVGDFKLKSWEASSKYRKTGNDFYLNLANSLMDSVYLYNSKIMWEVK